MRNKKKFIYATFGAILTLFLAFSAVLAVETETEGQREPKTKRQESLTQTTAQQNLETARANRLMALKRLMQAQINRSEKAIGRLQGLIERIEARRDKLEEKGAVMTEIDALIVTAKTQKTAAETALAKAKTDLAALEDSETPKQAVRTFMTSMKDLKKKLIELHRSLKAIVKEMKETERALAPAEEIEEAEGTSN
jgi:uncharacterized protein YukE